MHEDTPFPIHELYTEWYGKQYETEAKFHSLIGGIVLPNELSL